MVRTRRGPQQSAYPSPSGAIASRPPHVQGQSTLLAAWERWTTDPSLESVPRRARVRRPSHGARWCPRALGRCPRRSWHPAARLGRWLRTTCLALVPRSQGGNRRGGRSVSPGRSSWSLPTWPPHEALIVGVTNVVHCTRLASSRVVARSAWACPLRWSLRPRPLMRDRQAGRCPNAAQMQARWAPAAGVLSRPCLPGRSCRRLPITSGAWVGASSPRWLAGSHAWVAVTTARIGTGRQPRRGRRAQAGEVRRKLPPRSGSAVVVSAAPRTTTGTARSWPRSRDSSRARAHASTGSARRRPVRSGLAIDA